jgi:2-keto-4-pentenoate hydratase/2-oxohepta-3-ene-1,7-dioic acid hydratase in catechol pathway
MKLVRFDGDRVGLLIGDTIHDVSERAGGAEGGFPPVRMVSLIARYADRPGALAADLHALPRLKADSVRLECPIGWPNKVIAFPANFGAHVEESHRLPSGPVSHSAASGQGFFLKANSSLSGPCDPIVLPPLTGRQVHHEAELAIIIGKPGRAIPRDAALDHVFGYACLVDIVVRGREERVMRKSFDSFCPLGPWIVTADEVGDPGNLALQLSVNGEIRQQANTRDLIVDIPGMIAMASSVMSLFPGDVIASGTPAGVGPIRSGDRLVSRIGGVGELRLDVVQGEFGANPVWAATAE